MSKLATMKCGGRPTATMMKVALSREPHRLLAGMAYLLTAVAIAFAAANFGGRACGQTTSQTAELQTIEKALRDNPKPEKAAAFLPALVDAVQAEEFEALPLLEQALERALPGAVERHDWPSVAEALKTAARARFEQIETEKAGRHLQTLLALYREVAAARSRDADGPWRWLRQIHEVAAEYLRGEQSAEALAVLAEGADLGLPYRAELDDGRAALAGALHRRLAQLSADERYELLHEWTMPTQSRRTLRVFSSLAPVEAPPMAFARALGERPRSDSFPIAEIGSVPGLFSTAWSLVASAAETGRLRRLTAELQTAADEKLPRAEFVLLLANIAAADAAQTERLAAELLSLVKPTAETPADNATESQDNSADHLSSLLLAAGCLSREPSRSIGESLLDALMQSAPQQVPQRLSPMLRRAQAAAFLKRVSDASPDRLDDPNLALWLPTGAESADAAARSAAGGVWLAHEEHILRLAGRRHDYLCFRYPLSGDFEFHVEVQEGGEAGGGGLAFGGLTFGIDAAQLAALVGNVDLLQERLRPFPFIRQEAWPTVQRLEIRSNGRTMQFRCNGHPAWSEMPADLGCPWLALRCSSDRITAFRGLRFTGEPVIPREVRLCDDDSLRGWFAHYYPAAVSSTVPPGGGTTPAKRTPTDGFDWFAQQGEIHGAHRAGSTSPLPSRLTYFRPLADGESVNYEFFYEPGQAAVHPALGRLAFLLDPGGVQLHWLTSGANEWTGLDERNTVVEPLNRRGPKPLPLKIGDWNRVTISLAKGAAAVSLNNAVIYVRKLEPENPRTFSFYHDRRQTAARIRNVVLRGDWPERLTEQQLANLTAPRDVELVAVTRRALGAIFAERHVPDSALFAHRQAAALPLEARYAWLADWVLPGEDHAGLRLALDFTPTHPAPPVTDDNPLDAHRVAQAVQTGESRIQTGGNLVAPALDLVEVARRLGKLDDLRRRVEHAPQTDDRSRRARLTMLAIIDMAREQPKAANESLDKLLALLEAGDHTDFAQRWPETLATHAALFHPETRNAGRDLAYHLLLRQVRGGPDSGSEAWRRHVGAWARLSEYFETARNDAPLESLAAEAKGVQWRPASRTTAESRGRGYPRYRWQLGDARADHLASHNQDYLYFQSPLRGQFEAEYDIPGVIWRDTQLVVAGGWVWPLHGWTTYSHGTYRAEQPRSPIVPPLTGVGPVIHARSVVGDGACRTYINGRLIHEEPLANGYDPWSAIRNVERFTGFAENIRFTGQPEIPGELCLSDEEGLTGWYNYYDGMPGGPDAWSLQRNSSEGGMIVGRRLPELSGACAESLFRYHRPMFEDGVVEYQFYYRPGEIACHPALDRLVFLIEPTGVRIHWITDGAYDRTELAADNAFEEPACRRGAAQLPLEINAWNRLALELKGDVVRLRLNGRLVYQRRLELTNLRTFGLFHYADQTEARVRRVRWRGDWPRELPPVSEQELGGRYGDFLDARLAELPAKFEHDFARDGLSDDLFSIEPRDEASAISAQSDGLHITLPDMAGQRTAAVAPRLTVGGDFDATVAYERFQATTERDDRALLILLSRIDSRAEKECMLYRAAMPRAGDGNDEIIETKVARRQGASLRDHFAGREAFEAASGRLRMARRGETLYFLIAENDSPNFRVVRTEQVGTEDLVHEGLRILTRAMGMSRVDVVWKSFSIQAERLSGTAVEDASKLVVELDQRRDALAERFVHDFTRDKLSVDRFYRWNGEPPAEPQAGGLPLVARGTDAWSAAGIAPHVAVRGDYDVSLDIDAIKFDPPKQGDNSAIFLQVELPGERKRLCNVAFLEDDAGRQRVLVELRTQNDDGGFENRYPHSEPVESITRMRVARRGKSVFLLYSSDASRPDRLLAYVDASDAEVSRTGVRVFVHAGGAGRTAEVRLNQLSIRAEQLAVAPAVLPEKDD